MATPIIMPKQGQSVESCIIAKWHKQKGDKVAVGDMLDAVRTGKIKYLTDLTAFDTYRSDAIGKDKKSVALSFTFASLDGTLKDDEINGEMERILSILKRRFGAKIRG